MTLTTTSQLFQLLYWEHKAMDYDKAERLRFYLAEQGYPISAAMVMGIACGMDIEDAALLSHTLLEERRFSIAEAQAQPVETGESIADGQLDDSQLFEIACATLDEIQAHIKDVKLKEALHIALEGLDSQH